MIGAAAPAASMSRSMLDRTLLGLLTALLPALMISITLVGVLTGLIILVSLLRLADPALREHDRAPLAWPLLAFAVVTLASALLSPQPRVALYESKQLLGIAL